MDLDILAPKARRPVTDGASAVERSRGARARGQSIAPPSIPELVCRELRRQIGVGELKPGPLKISELARQFGVSPVPVREALRHLEAEGFVSFDHNRCVHVNSLSVDDLREIFLVREALETLLLSRAIPLAARDLALLSALEEQVHLMDDLTDDTASWREANAIFHWTLYGLVPMPRLRTMLQSLWAAVEPFMRIYVTSTDQLRTAQDQHKELLAYTRAGDVKAALTTLRHHLKDTIEAIELRLDRLSMSDESDS